MTEIENHEMGELIGSLEGDTKYWMPDTVAMYAVADWLADAGDDDMKALARLCVLCVVACLILFFGIGLIVEFPKVGVPLVLAYSITLAVRIGKAAL